MNFKPSQLASLILAGIFLAACSSRPRVKPINQINEPVFHQSNYLTLGIGGGPSWVNDDGPWFNLGDPPPDVQQRIYVDPLLFADINVTPWASFYLLPTYWNFLISGNQYQNEDPDRLKLHKMHSAIAGGISSVSYSGREGWTVISALQAQNKYLFNEVLFVEAGAAIESYNGLEALVKTLNLGIGVQWHPVSSVFASYIGSRYASSDHSATFNEIPAHDGDYLSRLNLSLPTYLRGKHVFTPETEYCVRNTEFSETWYFRFGAHYRFVFD